MSRTFCVLLLLAPHGVLLTSQMEELHVTFISPEFPTLKVKADCSDDDPSGGPMKIRVYPCIRKSRRLPDTTEIWGVCKEDGVKVCLSPLLRDEECVIILGRKGDVTYKSPELSLTNVTFLNRTNLRVKTTPWKQQGNTSVIRLQPVVGVPIYTLRLEGDSNNKNSNCNTVFLTGDTKEPFGEVVFTVHWHQQVDPGCTYRVWFMAKDECQEDMVYTYHTEMPELQYEYIQPSEEV
ncbi:uncharacterized protein LOC126998633 isoform X1 [Eriocheir sinensis]|uniref:uncharacterized protein LOC126998633 isoform X1 n=1 Tax=Eriocheir sinensis TaxID=95602 RepID=UPI0021C7D090|nr:uncharacterized protein LOC126998633 isoform X1 [Eriocheir sinensis]